MNNEIKTETIPQAILTRVGRDAIGGTPSYHASEGFTKQEIRDEGRRSLGRKARRGITNAVASLTLIAGGTGLAVVAAPVVKSGVERAVDSFTGQQETEAANQIQSINEQAEATGHEPVHLVNEADLHASEASVAVQPNPNPNTGVPGAPIGP
jgi:hypothetical protein